MSEDIYLFIDGEYLRSKYVGAMQAIFRSDGEINFLQIKTQAAAQRAYYYDCLDNDRRPGESEDQFRNRVAVQEALFSGIDDP